MAARLRLGVNVDHVATVRNARGGAHPDPVRAAEVALAGGAQSITAHLREDRRHIRDDDVERLRRLAAPLNLEMAATPEMLAIAARLAPHAVCLVPEKRSERTTEGGLDVSGEALGPMIAALAAAGCRVSLFVEPERAAMEAARRLGAPVVELHTGAYAEAHLVGDAKSTRHELDRIRTAAAHGSGLGLEIHAGHGLNLDNVEPVAAVPQLVELNIGHALVGDALFVGLEAAVAAMRAAMDQARAAAVA